MTGQSWGDVMRMRVGLLGLLLVVALGPGAVAQSSSPGPSPTAPAEGHTYVVAQDGSGDFATIGAAVAARRDGDAIHGLAGHPTASRCFLDKAVTVAGDGDQEAVLVDGLFQPAFHVVADGASLQRPHPGEVHSPERDPRSCQDASARKPSWPAGLTPPLALVVAGGPCPTAS